MATAISATTSCLQQPLHDRDFLPTAATPDEDYDDSVNDNVTYNQYHDMHYRSDKKNQIDASLEARNTTSKRTTQDPLETEKHKPLI